MYGGILKTNRLSAFISLFILTGTLLAAFGCGNSGGKNISSDSDRRGSNIISAAQGGVVSFNNEVSLIIPENALETDTEITIERVSEIPQGNADGLSPFGQAYRFGPAGTTFNISQPAILEIKYDAEQLAARGLSADTMEMYYYDAELGQYVTVNNLVRTDQNKLVARIEHFTIYLPMAKGKVAGNNPPYAAIQNPIPNPIRQGAPIHVRVTARDYDDGGAITGVVLRYRKNSVTPAEWHTGLMTREITPDIINTYGYTIPASFLGAADLVAGNDIEYQVEVTDNLGAKTTTALRAHDVTLTYQAGSTSVTPTTLDMSAGFERHFVVRGRDNNNTLFSFVPEQFSVTDDLGVVINRFASGILFQSRKAGAGTFSAGFGTETVSASITVYNGQLASVRVLDENSLPFTGPLVLSEGSRYGFDVLGYDDYDNSILIVPAWSADPAIGVIDQDGLLDATAVDGTGEVRADMGFVAGTQTVEVRSRMNEMLSLSVNGSAGVINPPFITVTLPYGTDVTALVAEFTTNGSSVRVGGAEQTSGVTANDFTGPVVYTVYAEDGSTRDYTVRMYLPKPFKDITSYALMGVPGIIRSNAIDLTLPYNTPLGSLVAEFTTTGAGVSVGGVAQVSGVSANDFRGQVVYRVTAEDGSTKDYTVRVARESAWSAPVLLESASYSPKTAIDPNGNAFAVWRQVEGSYSNIYVSRYVATAKAWSNKVLLESSNYDANSPYVKADGNGNAIAVWHQSDGTRYNIWASRYAAATNEWSPAVLIETTNSESAYRPKVAFDRNGNAIAIWEIFHTAYWRIMANRYNAATGTWGTEVFVGAINGYHAIDSNVNLGFDAAGNALAVWHQNDGTYLHVLSNRFDAATGTWGTPFWLETLPAGCHAQSPEVAVHPSGDAIVAWMEYDAMRWNIVARKYTAATTSWSGQVLLENMHSHAYSPKIAMDAFGNALVVWYQDNGGINNIYANRFDAATQSWGSMTAVEGFNGNAINPSIVMDGSGNAYAIWRQYDGYNYSTFANKFNAGTKTWGAVSLLETDSGVVDLAEIAVDPSGNAFAVWQQTTAGVIRVYAANTLFKERQWGTAFHADVESTYNAMGPRMGMNAAGDAMVVWMQSDGGRNRIWAKKFIAASGVWTEPAPVNDSYYAAESPDVALDRNGNAIVVFQFLKSGKWDLYVNNYDAATNSWSLARRIDTSTSHCLQAHIAMNEAGNAIVAWREWNGDANYLYRVYASYYSTGSHTWSAPRFLQAINGNAINSEPSVAIDPAGNAIVVWDENDGTYNIWASRYAVASGQWGTATILEDSNAGNAHTPRVSMDAAGYANAVWYQYNGAEWNVYANRYSPVSNSWGQAVMLDNVSGAAGFPDVATNADGDAVAVWYQTNGPRNQVYASRFDGIAESWSAPSALENNTGSADKVRAAINAAGDAVAIWQQLDGRWNIWGARYDAFSDSWASPELLEYVNHGEAQLPTLAIDSYGNIIAAWQQVMDGPYHVMINQFK